MIFPTNHLPGAKKLDTTKLLNRNQSCLTYREHNQTADTSQPTAVQYVITNKVCFAMAKNQNFHSCESQW